jgi:hypothetical protein
MPLEVRKLACAFVQGLLGAKSTNMDLDAGFRPMTQTPEVHDAGAIADMWECKGKGCPRLVKLTDGFAIDESTDRG